MIQAGRIDYQFEDDPNTWQIDNGSAANLRNSGYMHSPSTMFGIFGRADYAYQGKYLATVTVRRDASSRFSEKTVGVHSLPYLWDGVCQTRISWKRLVHG